MKMHEHGIFSWPLLGKELMELAARKRTYVLRVIYAVVLFIIFWMFYQSFSRYSYGARQVFNLLGSGERIFSLLVWVNFWAIYLLMPALMAGVITYEKERDSLHLLLLTDLRPWEIIWQKYISRLIPMLSFVLLSVPLLGLAFSFGGIGASRIYSAVYYIVLTCLQVGAYSLMVSAYCRTTTSAILVSYLGYAVFFGVMLFFGWAQRDEPEFLLCFIGAYQFEEYSGGPIPGSIPAGLSIAAFLLFARRFLVSRAFLPARNVLKEQYKKMDVGYDRMNQKLAKGVKFGKTGNGLPREEPIAWRELTKRSLGNGRYLLRHIMMLWIPVAFIAFLIVIDQVGSNRGRDREEFSVLVFCMWVIALLMILITSVSLIANERANQSLEVLTTTPVLGADVVRQKMRGLWRFMWVLGGAFGIAFITEAWAEGHFQTNSSQSILYLLFSFLSVAIYFPMVGWLGMLFGLKYEKRTKATMSALAFLCLWMALPYFLLMLAVVGGGNEDEGMIYLLLSSPVMMVVISEFWGVSKHVPGGILVTGVLNYVIYFGALYVLRSKCLLNADRYLGRVDGAPQSAVVAQPES